ncbi:MAG: YesL family protein [Oscillospiraceae bacterium]|nr:YesL family protein [Oscillospiraceae bacterium]
MKQDKKEKKAIKNKIILRLGEILQDSDGILSLVKLNLLFIATSVVFLPPVFIFTFGPAAAALSYCTAKMVKTGYQPDVVKTYMRTYKRCMKKAVVPGLIMVTASGIFSAGLYIYITMASENIMFIPMASVSLLVLVMLWCTGVHLFPAVAEADNNGSVKELMTAAFRKAVEKLPGTVITVIISAVFLSAMVLLLPATLPLLLTIAFSVPALAMAFAHTTPEW